MSEESLSGDPLSHYGQGQAEHSFEDFDGYNFDQIEDYDPTITNNNIEYQLNNDDFSSIAPPPTKVQRGKRGRPPISAIAKQKPAKNVQQQEDFEDGFSLSNSSFQNDNKKLNGHLFQDRSISNEFTGNSVSNYPISKTLPPKNKKNDDEQLSDYGNESDEQVSQYQNSLFGQLRSQSDVKSIGSFPKQKFNSSRQIDGLSDYDIKQSQKTNDMIAKRSDPNRDLYNKFKAQKRQKINQNSASVTDDRPVAISKRQKVENKKRFSKKQLELVSRKFSQYYAYETNRQYKGQKITLRQISQMFQLGHATIHKLYAQWMDDPYFYERIKRYDRYRKQTKNPERKLTLDRLQHITRLIKENPFLTQYELCVQLNKIQDLKVIKCGVAQNMTRTIVGKLLKMGKFRKKRVKCIPKQKNTSKSLEKRFQYCVKYKEILERRAKVYFLDESGFNLYMTRDKAWSRPNEEITVNCPISKGKRFSLIAIIGDDGLAHWRFIEGNYRKFEYLDFIRELFQKLVEHKSQDDPEQRWIVMDNCAIHDKEQTINLAKEHGINVLYMPSYSPQLNPIQNWFHEIKCKLKKINYSGEKQLFNIMERILKEYQEHDFSNYYHGSLKFVEKGLKKEKF